jgi:phage gp16-like protein
MNHSTTRNKQLAVIHALARDLKLSKDAYRNVCASLTGKRSAGDMTHDERATVIDFLTSQAKPVTPRVEHPPVSDEEALAILGTFVTW